MQLTFRGHTYTASNPAVSAAETSETATFLGKRYARKRYHTPLGQQHERLTYRGVGYLR